MGFTTMPATVLAALALAVLAARAVEAARGDHDYEEMFTTEATTTTTTTLSPVMRLYEERRLRERRQGLQGLGRYWRRRHALSRRGPGATRCADGESQDMLRLAPSGTSEALQTLLLAPGEVGAGALLEHARQAEFVFSGKVVGRGGVRGRRAAERNATRRGRQTQDLVPRGAVLWVRVKRMLKGDLADASLVRLQTTAPATGGARSTSACPPLLRVHHTAIFLANKAKPGWGRANYLDADEEANTVSDYDERAPHLQMAADPFALTLRNLQISARAAKGNKGYSRPCL